MIENAPKIISDLRAIFPPEKGHYVVAPFLKIGWGTPTIVEVDLGILLELPFQKRLVLLGSVGIYLPSKKVKKKLVELHIDIFGDFNFAASYVLIEGRLRDSHVVGITLTGGFAFVLDWGPQPKFLMSVGGYHPRYKKPERFPAIPRLTALIKRGSSFKLSCQYYQAITSNTFQIGFAADLLVKKGRAKATGHLSFNALLQFNPFYFETDIRISVDVSYRGRSFAGIDLYFLLSGPKPWRAKGYAKIKILFFSLKIRFNISWGGKQERTATKIQTVTLLGDLEKQLGEAANWSGRLPAGFTQIEALKSLNEEEKQDQIFVHPSGFLELRQSLLPLNKTIERVGNSEVPEKPDFQIVSYQIGDGDGPFTPFKQRHALREHFSRGQFENLSDDKKLSTADFDLMNAGLQLEADDSYDFAFEVEGTPNDFENVLLGIENVGERSLGESETWQQYLEFNLSGGRTTSHSNRPEDIFGMVEELPDYEEQQFVIISKNAIKVPDAVEEAYFKTYTEASDYLKNSTPEQRAKWQIVEASLLSD